MKEDGKGGLSEERVTLGSVLKMKKVNELVGFEGGSYGAKFQQEQVFDGLSMLTEPLKD